MPLRRPPMSARSAASEVVGSKRRSGAVLWRLRFKRGRGKVSAKKRLSDLPAPDSSRRRQGNHTNRKRIAGKTRWRPNVHPVSACRVVLQPEKPRSPLPPPAAATTASPRQPFAVVAGGLFRNECLTGLWRRSREIVRFRLKAYQEINYEFIFKNLKQNIKNK